MKIARLSLLVCATFVFCVACQPSQRILEDAKRNEPPPAADGAAGNAPRDDFEDRLKSVQTGNFQFIYVFRRRDGAALTGDDKRFLKQNSPSDTNQWVLTTDEKAVIAGSNYVFTTENLENLQTRFEVNDFSIKK